MTDYSTPAVADVYATRTWPDDYWADPQSLPSGWALDTTGADPDPSASYVESGGRYAIELDSTVDGKAMIYKVFESLVGATTFEMRFEIECMSRESSAVNVPFYFRDGTRRYVIYFRTTGLSVEAGAVNIPSTIAVGDWATITLRRIGDYYYIWHNNVLVHMATYASLTGDTNLDGEVRLGNATTAAGTAKVARIRSFMLRIGSVNAMPPSYVPLVHVSGYSSRQARAFNPDVWAERWEDPTSLPDGWSASAGADVEYVDVGSGHAIKLTSGAGEQATITKTFAGLTTETKWEVRVEFKLDSVSTSYSAFSIRDGARRIDIRTYTTTTYYKTDGSVAAMQVQSANYFADGDWVTITVMRDGSAVYTFAGPTLLGVTPYTAFAADTDNDGLVTLGYPLASSVSTIRQFGLRLGGWNLPPERRFAGTTHGR